MKQSLSKDDVLICDIDGTLTKIGPRIHFAKEGQWDAFHLYGAQDEVHENIATLVRFWFDLGGYVLIVTSRPSKFRQQTAEWFKRNTIHYDALLMSYPGIEKYEDQSKKSMLIGDWKATEPNREKTLWFILDDRQKVIDNVTNRFKDLHGIRVNEELY